MKSLFKKKLDNEPIYNDKYIKKKVEIGAFIIIKCLEKMNVLLVYL